MEENNGLPDVQNSEPDIKSPIMQVGVENVEVPFKLESKYGGHHQMTANVSLRTSLSSNLKGISMSRLLLTLKPYLDYPLKSVLIKDILKDIIETVQDEESKANSAAYITFEFKLPILKESIVSNNSFPIYYKCRFEGQLFNAEVIDEIKKEKEQRWYFRFFQGVKIQYASYCPCSAELCDSTEEKAYPHNQRSFADVIIEVDSFNNKYIWLEDIIENVESVLPTIPYPIIKRIDEQEIGKVAAQNPMFVEDSIRAISKSIDGMDGVIDWIVKCSHEESIHTSEAIAINWKGIYGGFDGRRYI